MGKGKYVDALALKPGDKILVGPGRVETVTAPSKKGDRYNDVTIHTDESDILAGLPCAVKVLDS